MIVAVGVNLGIVPLLFVQLAYYKVFYPATILMAWFWLAIIVLLIPAYYGVYAYAWGLADSQRRSERAMCVRGAESMPGWRDRRRLVRGGVLHLHRLPVRQRPEPDGSRRALAGAVEGHSTAGAAPGTALNVGDPTLWPRWLLMFGLALGTTAVWLLVDAGLVLTRGTTDEAYQRWAWGFARKLYTLACCGPRRPARGTSSARGRPSLRETMFQWPLLVLTVATAIAPGLPWLLMMTAGLVLGEAGDRGRDRLLPVRRAGHQRRQPAGRAEHEPEAVSSTFPPSRPTCNGARWRCS